MSTAGFYRNLRRAEEILIKAVAPSLKVKVELLCDGRPVECGSFDNTPEAGDWMAAKAREWRKHTPHAKIRFRTI